MARLPVLIYKTGKQSIVRGNWLSGSESGVYRHHCHLNQDHFSRTGSWEVWSNSECWVYNVSAGEAGIVMERMICEETGLAQ
jgi:hypothetical protein